MTLDDVILAEVLVGFGSVRSVRVDVASGAVANFLHDAGVIVVLVCLHQGVPQPRLITVFPTVFE
eukprot:CAMPEP_0198120538 /NCGR_PEP_ID=MMETSP1442-20131203/29382_1 /TAXON_ID= /ORGANISM="Craspedostauros australis, Strain CCMP3328" /LENGTH=64 /DNA_ID=CAMNT_0043779199 /DNA_START=700 /DNA_END=891 /DNA_ORIENTATION=+